MAVFFYTHVRNRTGITPFGGEDTIHCDTRAQANPLICGKPISVMGNIAKKADLLVRLSEFVDDGA